MTPQLTVAAPKGALWTGRILSGLAIAFLAWDGVIKLIQHPMAVETTQKLGYASSVLPMLGALEILSALLYVYPRTALLGAVLMTGYLGGAVATHVRAGSDTFSVIFPVIIGALMWGGLWLRNHRLRALAPWQASDN